MLTSRTSAARHELNELQDRIALARHDLAGASDLQLANEKLVCSALKSQRESDDCHETLRQASRASERDPLTALPNRALLLDRLVHAIRHARRHSTRLALLFIDLDGFKQINDAHGHAAGDGVLQQVAQRLRHVVREEDTVSRYGGDEFLILLADIAAPQDAVAVADTLIEAFDAPIQVPGGDVWLGISVGISLFPDHGQEAGDLIESADAAMYIAKRSEGHCALVGEAASRPRRSSSHAPVSPLAVAEMEKRLAERRQALLCETNERLLLAALESRHSQDAAETAHRLQRENLAVVAHELRGPLSPIRVAAALLPGLDAAEIPRVQAIIERGVVQLTRLVGDLLDLSRVHTGKLRMEPQRIDLQSVVEGALEQTRPAIEARQQQLVVAMRSEPLWIVGDAVRLTQVFRNLLDNATKYTPEGGTLRVSVGERCDAAEVVVCDSGIGIPLDSLSRVFEAFEQEDRAIDFNDAGLGIGLTVVRELVEAHGGTVAACSEGPGRGSSFVVTLPLAPPSDRAVSRPH